jgi:hypothetical protein
VFPGGPRRRLATAGPAADAGRRLGRASLVSWRGRFMNWPLTRPSRPVLIVAIPQECRALRLLYRDMATGRQ